MDAVFLELLNRSLAASWLVLAVLLLRPLTQRAPKNLRCLLWAMAALRLLLPAGIRSPLSLLPSASPIRVAPGAAPTVQSGFSAVDAAINPALAGSLAPTPAASADPAQIWLHIGALVWLAGMAVMLLYALVSFLLLRRRSRTRCCIMTIFISAIRSTRPLCWAFCSRGFICPSA